NLAREGARVIKTEASSAEGASRVVQFSQSRQVGPALRAEPGALVGLARGALGRCVALLALDFGEPGKRPAVVANADERIAKRLFGIVEPALAQAHRRERLAHRVVPVRRLGVGKRVFDLDRALV